MTCIPSQPTIANSKPSVSKENKVPVVFYTWDDYNNKSYRQKIIPKKSFQELSIINKKISSLDLLPKRIGRYTLEERQKKIDNFRLKRKKSLKSNTTFEYANRKVNYN